MDSFEEDDDLQVKGEIATQLVALDEEIFISFLKSRGKDIRLLVLKEIDNYPWLVARAGKKIFLESYIDEVEPNLLDHYHTIFDQIGKNSFEQEEIDKKREWVKNAAIKLSKGDIGKIARLCGLLCFPEGVEICSIDNLGTMNDYFTDILWMKRRLVRSGSITLSEDDAIEIKNIFDLIQRSTLNSELELCAFEYLTVLGDIHQLERRVYIFFTEIMTKSSYKKQVRLLSGLIDAQSHLADIILCNALTNNDYSLVREKATSIISERRNLLCIETIRNIVNDDPDFEVRYHAIKIISDKGGLSDKKYLIKAVFDTDVLVSKTALDYLNDKELDEESTAAILGIINNHDDINWKVKALKLILKTKLRNIDTAEILVEALEDVDQSIKTTVIAIVGEFKGYIEGSSVLERIKTNLEYYLVNDSFFETRAEAAISIGKIGFESSIPLLIERFAKEEDFEVKRGIILALTELKSAGNRIIDYYRNILSNPGKIGKKELLLALEGSGMMKTTDLLGLVMKYFSDDDYFLKWQSIVSSGEIIECLSDIESLPAGFSTELFAIALNDDLPTIRAAACWTISRNIVLFQLEKTVNFLLKILKNDKDSMVREIAAESLGTYRSPFNRAIPELIKIIKEESDPSVRYYGVHSLGCIARSISGKKIDVKKPKMEINE